MLGFVTIHGSSGSPLFAVNVWMTKWVVLNQLCLYLAFFLIMFVMPLSGACKRSNCCCKITVFLTIEQHHICCIQTGKLH